MLCFLDYSHHVSIPDKFDQPYLWRSKTNGTHAKKKKSSPAQTRKRSIAWLDLEGAGQVAARGLAAYQPYLSSFHGLSTVRISGIRRDIVTVEYHETMPVLDSAEG